MFVSSTWYVEYLAQSSLGEEEGEQKGKEKRGRGKTGTEITREKVYLKIENEES